MKCSDCGRDIEDPTLEGVCAERHGHEARCSCQPHYYGSGLFFPLPPGARPGAYAGHLRNERCPIHGADAEP